MIVLKSNNFQKYAINNDLAEFTKGLKDRSEFPFLDQYNLKIIFAILPQSIELLDLCVEQMFFS